MRTYLILYEMLSEYSTSARDPRRVYRPEQPVDFTQQAGCVLNSDDWRPVSVDRWDVQRVTLPDWLSAEEWIEQRTQWKWAWAFGCDPEWPEAWQRFITYGLKDHEGRRLAVVQLLRSTPATSFRHSLRLQLIEWLNAPPEQRRFETPFSPKQWGVLTNRWIVRRAHQLSQHLYYHRPLDRGPVTWHQGRRKRK